MVSRGTFSRIIGYVKNWVLGNLVQGRLSARGQVGEGSLSTCRRLLARGSEVVSLLALLLGSGFSKSEQILGFI
jgi:hypothetical protein